MILAARQEWLCNEQSVQLGSMGRLEVQLGDNRGSIV